MENLEKILSKFEAGKIVVIGDIMLDKYLEGEVHRINPEAPVPIVSLKKEFFELGGAANVASNISSLGGKVSLFGFVANDNNGKIIKELLMKKEINYFLDECKQSITKTRIVSSGQQLLRFDKEETSEKKFTSSTKQNLLQEVEKADIVVISDYAKGAITQDLMNTLSKFKSKIIVDSKPKNKHLCKDIFLIKLNREESLVMSSYDNIYAAGNSLRKELNSNILITRGKEGMSLFSDKMLDIPTYAREIYDVTGAGDTTIAALALAISTGADLGTAAIIANHAAGIAVEKKGTYSVTIKELKEKILSENKKILSFEDLIKKVEDNKRKNRKIVWTNGCFDLLHVGHVKYLKEAKKLGDILVVGINSDESVKKLKGPERPIQTEQERAEILSSLEFINYIIIFPELTVEKYLRKLKPEIFIKGGDYTVDTINRSERKIVEEYGGKIVIIPVENNISTSKIIEKLRNRNQ